MKEESVIYNGKSTEIADIFWENFIRRILNVGELNNVTAIQSLHITRTLNTEIASYILAREKKLLEELREIYASNDLAFGKLVTNIIDQKLKERE